MVYAVGAKTKFNIVNTIYSALHYGHRVYFPCLCFFGFALIWFRLLWILPSTIRIKTIWNSVNVERYVPAANSITLMHKYRESKKRKIGLTERHGENVMVIRIHICPGSRRSVQMTLSWVCITDITSCIIYSVASSMFSLW